MNVKTMCNILKKIAVLLVIFMVLNNFFISSYVSPVYAVDDPPLDDYDEDADDATFAEALEAILGTVVGLLTWPFRLIAIGAAYAVDMLTAAVAYSEGRVTENGSVVSTNRMLITPSEILFNKVALVDVNIFRIGNTTTVVNNIRTSIAGWYTIMRTLATAILLIVLIYVGIRMALSTIATDKAMYKKMLVDWVASIALIYILHYIILFVVNINSILVKALGAIGEDGLDDAIREIRNDSFGISMTAIASTIVYCMIVIQTLGLLITYINRMLKLSFLVIIAPLITLTYSMDKMGDGKAQALGNWLNEFIFTVLIQPFHCIIYMVFVSAACKILDPQANGLASYVTENNSIVGSVFAILCISFTKEGEKIVKKIFGFKDSSKGLDAGTGLAMAAVAKSKDIGAGAKKAIGGAKNFTRQAQGLREAAAVNKIANQLKDQDTTGTKTDADFHAEAQAQYDEKKAQKLSKKAGHKDRWSKANEANFSDEEKKAFGEELQRVQEANPALSPDQARAKARRNLSANDLKAHRDSKFKTIKGVTGKVKELDKRISSNPYVKFAKEHAPQAIALGLGTAMGAMNFGAKGKFDEAVLSGVAMHGATKEFLSNTNKTLRDDTVDRLNSMDDVKTSADAAKKMQDISRKGDSGFYDNQQEAKKVKDAVKNALDKLNLGNRTNEFTQKLDRAIKQNPNQSINDIISNVSTGMGIHLDGASRGAAAEFCNFQQEKAIYSDMQGAAGLGVTADAFSSRVVSEFGGSEPTGTVADKKDVIRGELNGLEERKADIYDRLDNAPDSGGEHDRIVAELDQVEEEIKAKKAELTEELKQEAKEHLENAATELHGAEAKLEKLETEIQDKMDELKQIHQQYGHGYDPNEQVVQETLNRLNDAKRSAEKELEQKFNEARKLAKSTAESYKIDGEKVASDAITSARETLVSLVNDTNVNHKYGKKNI